MCSGDRHSVGVDPSWIAAAGWGRRCRVCLPVGGLTSRSEIKIRLLRTPSFTPSLLHKAHPPQSSTSLVRMVSSVGFCCLTQFHNVIHDPTAHPLCLPSPTSGQHHAIKPNLSRAFIDEMQKPNKALHVEDPGNQLSAGECCIMEVLISTLRVVSRSSIRVFSPDSKLRWQIRRIPQCLSTTPFVLNTRCEYAYESYPCHTCSSSSLNWAYKKESVG